MNIKNIKLALMATITTGAIAMTTFHSIAMANPDGNWDTKHGHCDQKQMSPEKMHAQMKARLDKLAGRLEIKASQQAAWEEFAKSVETLADRNVKKPGDDADAAAIAHYRAEKATAFANNLTKVADSTTKLQTALTEDQRKILNQAARRFLHNDQGWNHKHHGLDRGGSEHKWDMHENSDSMKHQKDS